MPTVDVMHLPQFQEKRRVVMLTLTHDCNLRCKYCYEPNKSRDYMSFDIATNAIKHFMTEENEYSVVEIQFFGGEPFLAFDTMRDVIEWFHHQSWKKRHIFFITTNGTILTDEIKEMLLKYRSCLWVGVSLDGNRIAHNLSRSVSYDRVMQNLPFFLMYSPTQPVKMTICEDTLPYIAESIIDLEEKKILFTANLVYENIWGDCKQKAELLRIYADQLEHLIDYYLSYPDLYPPKIISANLDGFILNPEEFHQYQPKRWCGAGHEMVMVDLDGSVYPCHRFSSWVTNKFTLGENVNLPVLWRPEQCEQCRLIKMCPTCAGYNYEVNGDGSIRTTHHCEAFKLEVMASCKYYTEKILNSKEIDLSKMTSDEVQKIKKVIDTILYINNYGL